MTTRTSSGASSRGSHGASCGPFLYLGGVGLVLLVLSVVLGYLAAFLVGHSAWLAELQLRLYMPMLLTQSVAQS